MELALSLGDTPKPFSLHPTKLPNKETVDFCTALEDAGKSSDERRGSSDPPLQLNLLPSTPVLRSQPSSLLHIPWLKRKRDGADGTSTSDDEENGSTRKKRRLSEERSAFHEEIIEIFEEHTTPFHEEIFEKHTTPTEMRIAAEGDVESGGGETERPPTMLENPQLRWSFIRKVYSIISIQFLLTIAVASVAIFVRPVALFFVNTIKCLALYIVLIFVPFIRFCPIKYYSLLFIWTVALAFTNGLGWAFESWKVILEAISLTTAVVSSLSLYTFWAARRGHDFHFLRPFLTEALVVIILYAFIQTLFPLGKLSVMIYGCLASIMYGGYIIYDTDNIIKRLPYDELIWASFSLYLNIISLFSSLFTLLLRHM